MPLKYGDSVILIQKSGEELRRLNAIVLTSATQPKDAVRATGLKDHKGDLLPEGEYIDLVFPRPFENGQAPKTREVSALFQYAYGVAPWKDGAFIGWQPAPTQAHIAALRAENADLKKKLAPKNKDEK